MRQWSECVVIRSNSGSSASQIFAAFHCGDFPSLLSIATLAAGSKSLRLPTTDADLAIGRRGSDRPLHAQLGGGYADTSGDGSEMNQSLDGYVAIGLTYVPA
jgi:hypothetical protein